MKCHIVNKNLRSGYCCVPPINTTMTRSHKEANLTKTCSLTGQKLPQQCRLLCYGNLLTGLQNAEATATGNLNKPLGGISTWIIGDFTQLLLVGDEPIHAFLSQSSSLLAQHGHSIYSLFEAVVTLSENIRQAGNNPEPEDGMKRCSHHWR